MTEYDLVVIGGGSGGIASARRAAKYGAKVLVVEGKKIGGTCVNVGCVPKKVMWNAAHVGSTVRASNHYCFDVSDNFDFDFEKFKKKRDDYIVRLNGIYSKNLDKDGIKFIEGFAAFEDSNTIIVGENKFKGKNFLIATGGKPNIPDIEGASLGATSDDFFNSLDHLPKKVVIAGSGYIAVELAGLLNSLGSEVSLVIRKNKILGNFDIEISEELLKQIESSGIDVLKESEIQKLEKNSDSITVRISKNRTINNANYVIWAIGRSPLSKDLKLRNVGVKTDAKGFIAIDEFQNTTSKNIFAVGDVTDRPQLTPVAIKAGRHLSERLFNNQSQLKLDYSLIPTVIFSHPPVGTVGLSEAEARKKYGEGSVTVFKSKFVNMFYSVMETKPATFVKLITVGEEQKVVGLHGVGMAMDEMVQGFAVALKVGATKADFDSTIAIHPTASEEFVTLT